MRIELGRDATLGGKRVARVESRRRGIFHFVLEDPTEVRTLGRSALLLEGARLSEGEPTEPLRRRVMVRVAAAIEVGRGSTAVVVCAAPELEGLDFGFAPLLAGMYRTDSSELRKEAPGVARRRSH
jgi:hypothetical protein